VHDIAQVNTNPQLDQVMSGKPLLQGNRLKDKS